MIRVVNDKSPFRRGNPVQDSVVASVQTNGTRTPTKGLIHAIQFQLCSGYCGSQSAH